MKRDIFYDNIRKTLFGGRLTQQTVDGIEAIIDEWEAQFNETGAIEHLAYILATTYHETARTMQAIEEFGKGA
ncbi:MAG: hypothetical protein ACK4RS_00205, partial [Thiothrix sp.]